MIQYLSRIVVKTPTCCWFLHYNTKCGILLDSWLVSTWLWLTILCQLCRRDLGCFSSFPQDPWWISLTLFKEKFHHVSFYSAIFTKTWRRIFRSLTHVCAALLVLATSVFVKVLVTTWQLPSAGVGRTKVGASLQPKESAKTRTRNWRGTELKTTEGAVVAKSSICTLTP